MPKATKAGKVGGSRAKPNSLPSSLAVGMDAIDRQHLSLVNIYNKIVESQKHASSENIIFLLEELGNATYAHFKYEEKLMVEAGYEHAESHRVEHNKLLDELGEQVQDFRDGHISAPGLAQFMYGWLTRHIATFDMQMVQYFGSSRVQ